MTQGHSVEMSEKRIFLAENSFFRWSVPMLFFILAISLGIYFPRWLMASIEIITKGLGK